MPNPNKVLLVGLLDRSGSMSSIQPSVIAGWNQVVAEQTDFPGECLVSLYQFDAPSSGFDWYHSTYKNVPALNAPPLNYHNFVPRGGTALNDALALTIDLVGADLAALREEDRPGKIVFVVMTDGYENASNRENKHTVKARVDRQTNIYNWQFVYIGANQDAEAVGASIGVPTASSLNYASNSISVGAAYASVAKNARGFFTGASASCEFTAADKEVQNSIATGAP